jgi:hypothetical protein
VRSRSIDTGPIDTDQTLPCLGWTRGNDIHYYPPALRGWSPECSPIWKQHMDNEKWAFGLTMMVVGMGGTFLTLWILGLVMDLLKKIFPLPHKASSSEKQS